MTKSITTTGAIVASLALAVLFSPFAPSSSASASTVPGAGEKPRNPKKLLDEAAKLAKKSEHAKAASTYVEAADLFGASGMKAERIDALLSAGSQLQYFEKDFAAALDLYSKALADARSLNDAQRVVSALNAIAVAEKLLSHTEKSLAAYAEVLAMHEAAKEYSGVVATLSNMAGVHAAAGATAKADEYRERAARVREEHKVPPPIMRVSGGVLSQAATKRPQPSYPAEARNAGVQGSVTVEVIVSIDGTVERARAINGPIELRDAAVEAAEKWKFQPVRVEGELVRVQGTIVFHFRKL